MEHFGYHSQSLGSLIRLGEHKTKCFNVTVYVLCFVFCVLCFVFYVLCFVFYVLCFVFCVLCFLFYVPRTKTKNQSPKVLIEIGVLELGTRLKLQLAPCREGGGG